jgi:ABC-type multidrug transport system fused ATPase/permease subunit
MSGASVITPNYQLDPAYTRRPPIALLEQIEQLQRDGLLLLDHLTKRSERVFVVASGDKKPVADDGLKPGIAGLSLEPLRQSPEDIAKAENGLRNLALLVDELSRLAAPVTSRTIRNSQQGWLGPFDLVLLAVLGVTMFLSVAFFWRVDEARSLINQTRQAQAAANEIYGRLNLLDRKAQFERVPEEKEPENSLKGALCNLDDVKPHYVPIAPEAEGLCSGLAQQKAREAILFDRLRTWNCNLTQDWATRWIIRPLVAGTRNDQDTKELDYGACRNLSLHEINNGMPAYHWQRSERRTVTVLTLMANHILPGLLALLGASIYLLRLRQRQKARSVLEDTGMAGLARLLMPAALGGLLGLVWTDGGDVINPNSLTLQNITVSLPLTAFVLGYAFDPILEWLENKIRETLIGKQPETRPVPLS